MIDFKEMMKPENLEKARKAREAYEKQIEAELKAQKFMHGKLLEMVRGGEIDSDWECEFIRSLSYRINAGLPLTDKQDAKLTQIFERW
jgi:hypothetical protein